MNRKAQPPMIGDCYESSLKNAVELRTIKEAFEGSSVPDAPLSDLYSHLQLVSPIQIVHGWMTSPNGPAKGKRNHHAWIEVGDLVVETQCGKLDPRPKGLYYDVFQIHPNEYYTIEEAESLAGKVGYGAWRGKGCDRHNDAQTTNGEQVVPPNGP